MQKLKIYSIPQLIRNCFDDRPHLSRILGNVSWLFADRLLNLFFGLLVGIWVARYLGPEQYGLFSYVLAFVTLFAPLSALGLDGVVVRDIVNNPAGANETLGSAFALKFVGGVITLCVAVSGIMFLRPGDETTHLFVAIISLGVVFRSLDVIDLWFQAQGQPKYIVIARSITLFIAAMIKIWLITIRAPLLAFVWISSIEIMLTGIGFLAAFAFLGKRLQSWRISIERIRGLLHDCWPLAISSIAIILYMKIDVIMLGQMLDSSAVGIYSVATRLSEVWYFIPVAIMIAVAPTLIEAKKLGEVFYYQKILNVFRIMSLLSFSIILPIMLLSQNIVVFLFGPEYNQAGIILNIHVWSSIFVFLGTAQGTWDIIEGLTRNALKRTLLGAVINIVLNLVLIPMYGGVGSAVATVVAYAFSATILNLFSVKTKSIFWLQLRSMLLIR